MKIITVLLWVCFCSSVQGAERPARRIVMPGPPRSPNIIFILADDLGYGDIGAYGQKKIQTPNLDKMAAEGMRFTSFYAGSTVCAPSRACLMTGFHTGHGRIRGNEPVPLAPEDVTVAELLKRCGYRTAAIGKWGLGLEGTTGIPNRKGFHEWFGYLDQVHAHDYYPEYLWRNEQKFVLNANALGKQGTYAPNWFTLTATNFVRVNEDRSFFMYLAYTIPHANNELKNKGMQVPNNAPYGQQDWPEPEKNKAAMITRLDNDVGTIMEKLKAFHIDERTIVFFASDNGPHKEGGVDPAFFNSAGPLRGIKRDLYEGGIRVPMIARWPGKVPAGKTNDQAWAFWDFLPTAVEIASGKTPDGIDGISMLPALLGQAQTKQHDFLYWEFHENGFKQAVRMGHWKGVKLTPDQPLELFDLSKDLGEKENVAAQNPEIVSKIEDYLKTARTDSVDWPVKARTVKSN